MFSYNISDPTNNVPATATLDIMPVNDAPQTTPVTLAPIQEDSSVRIITRAELLANATDIENCLLYTSPSPRDQRGSRMPSSA